MKLSWGSLISSLLLGSVIAALCLSSVSSGSARPVASSSIACACLDCGRSESNCRVVNAALDNHDGTLVPALFGDADSQCVTRKSENSAPATVDLATLNAAGDCPSVNSDSRELATAPAPAGSPSPEITELACAGTLP